MQFPQQETATAQPAGKTAAESRKLGLDECIALGMESPPALAVAHVSLNAAYSGQRGVSGLPRFAGLLARDLPIRREQACLGVTIASAGLEDQAQAMYNDALFQQALVLTTLERVTAGGYRIAAGK